MLIRITKHANDDLIRMYEHIAQYSPQRAKKVMQKISKMLRLLYLQPQMGKLWKIKSIRRLPIPDACCLVFYIAEDNVLIISRVLSMKKNPPDIHEAILEAMEYSLDETAGLLLNSLEKM